MRFFQREKPGWASCVICGHPRPAAELTSGHVCVGCWIRGGREKGWALDAAKPRGAVEWSETAETVRGLASVERPGEEGRRHVVTGLFASFNLAHLGLLTVRAGEGDLLVKTYCHSHRELNFGRLVIPEGESVAAGLMFRGSLAGLQETAAATVLMVGMTEPAEGVG